MSQYQTTQNPRQLKANETMLRRMPPALAEAIPSDYAFIGLIYSLICPKDNDRKPVVSEYQAVQIVELARAKGKNFVIYLTSLIRDLARTLETVAKYAKKFAKQVEDTAKGIVYKVFKPQPTISNEQRARNLEHINRARQAFLSKKHLRTCG